MATGEDWRRAAEAVEARMSELRMGRAALARTAGVDRKTVDNFLDRGSKPRTEKRGGYEVALGWRHGSLLTVARGGEPSVAGLDPDAEALWADVPVAPVADTARPVGLGLDDEAEGLTAEQIESVRAVIRAMKPSEEGV
jgi:hypothetical protein